VLADPRRLADAESALVANKYGKVLSFRLLQAPRSTLAYQAAHSC
jgi:hypothetical protein